MPFLTGYSKRKEIRYGTVFPTANLTDFPLYIDIVADADIASELGFGGGIAVTAVDGTTVTPFGLHSPTVLATGNIKLSMLASSLLTGAATGDPIGYLYFDASKTTVQNRAGVVPSGYDLFMPLEDDPSTGSPQIRNWVTDTLIGTTNGSMANGDLVTGQVGNALNFDGTDDNIHIGSTISYAGDFFCSFWFNSDDFGVRIILGNGADANPLLGFLSSNTSISIRGESGGANSFSLAVLSTGTWYKVTFSRSSGVISAAINGALSGTGGLANASVFSFDLIGGYSTPTFGWDGRLDEMKSGPVAVSVAYIGYSYVNEVTPGNTTTLGPLEIDTPSPPTIPIDVFESSIFKPILF